MRRRSTSFTNYLKDITQPSLPTGKLVLVRLTLFSEVNKQSLSLATNTLMLAFSTELPGPFSKRSTDG